MTGDNIDIVAKNIQAACGRVGRESKDVTLIAVSKTKPVSAIMEAYEHGIREFGENKVQELTQKAEVLPKDIRWHMIGHLQRNKVKYVVGKAALIHSVDSVRLAEEISREAVKKQITVSILIEVNIAGEDSKFGVSPGETEALIREIAKLPGIHIEGLMTIAPYVDDAEENRQYFSALKQLSVDIKRKNIDNVNVDVLSMGMTGDYMVAVEEGASYVRVGTGIFGERQYPV
ncbi:MAG: YggS family pyridoxal phosphate-dependent enzyme [Lachnospiraceae bacterium]|nr:YggS family pyridoxal phosphate-dependent enzyme [Lachnospiraceae bacterium]